MLLIGFAFLAGIVTVLSPCILPVLPIVLSGSIGGGKRKPWGVLVGFVSSFTFFTLFLSQIVVATGLSADSLRLFAVVVILLFGVSMLVPGTQVVLERLFARLSSLVPRLGNGAGFGSGLLVGVSLGLIWTPCVGPILASVISLALTGSVSGAAVGITLAYAFGTGLPMLAVMYGGRKLLLRVPWLLRNTGRIQQIFGLIMILVAVAIYANFDRKFQVYVLEIFPAYGTGLTALEDNDWVDEALTKFRSDPVRSRGTHVEPDSESE